MKPPASRDTGRGSPPSGRAEPRPPLLLPAHRELKELRRLLAGGGLPAHLQRSPEDWARIASFRAVEELLRLLDEYRRRTERGERCRLVEREHKPEKGRLLLEIVIEGDS